MVAERPARNVVAAGVGGAALLIAVAGTLLLPTLVRFSDGYSAVVAAVSTQERPQASDVLALARSALIALVPFGLVVVVASVLARMLLAAPIRAALGGATFGAAFGRIGRRDGPRTGMATLTSAVRQVAVGLLLVVAAVLATAWTMREDASVARGTVLMLYTPSPATLIAAGVAIVVAAGPVGSLIHHRSHGVAAHPRRIPGSPTASGRRWVVVGAACMAALLTLFVMCSVLAQPIADDYKYFDRIDRQGALGYVPEHMRIETGRYASAALIGVSYAAFGEASVRVVPIVVLLGIGGSIAALAYAWLPFRRAERLSGSIFAGLIGTTSAAVLAPSPVDTYFWLTSTLVYLPPLVLVGPLVLIVRVAERSSRRGRRMSAALSSAVLVMIASGFNEPFAVGTVLVLAAVTVATLVQRRGRLAVLRGSLLTVSLICTLVLAFAPSQATRIEQTSTGNLALAVAGGISSPVQLLALVSPTEVLLVVAAGALLGTLLRTGAPGLDRRRWALLIAGAALLVLPVMLSSAISFYGTGWAAWRTYGPGAAAFGCGVILIVAVLASWGPQIRQMPVIAGIGVVVAVAAATATPVHLTQAFALRGSLMAARDAAVQRQLDAGADVVRMVPAPVLAVPSDARDLEFRAVQTKEWFLPGYRAYFGIPTDVEVMTDPTVPLGYCLNGIAQPSILIDLGLPVSCNG